MNLEHYILSRRYKNDPEGVKRLDPESRILVQEWIDKISSGQIVIHELKMHPWEKRDMFQIINPLNLNDKESEDEELIIATTTSRYLVSPKFKEAIDALEGEYLYLWRGYDDEFPEDNIISIFKSNELFEKYSGVGGGDGESIERYESSDALIDFMVRIYPDLTTTFELDSPQNIPRLESLALGFPATQILDQNLKSLGVFLGSLENRIDVRLEELNQEGWIRYAIELNNLDLVEWLDNHPAQTEPLHYEVLGPKEIILR